MPGEPSLPLWIEGCTVINKQAYETCFFSDPMNGRVLRNVEKYEKLLVSSPIKSIRGDGLRRPTSNHLRTRDTYERLCQTQGSQVFITINVKYQPNVNKFNSTSMSVQRFDTNSSNSCWDISFWTKVVDRPTLPFLEPHSKHGQKKLLKLTQK